MFTIKTLQQRLIIFLILPVAVFLTAIGAGGYFYRKFQQRNDKKVGYHIDSS